MQKPVEWSSEKNEWLKAHRGVCFEDVASIIDAGMRLQIEDNPSANHPNQKIYVVEIRGYVYAVPFVEDEEKIFLKTIYPSRKYKQKYFLLKDN